MIHKTMRSILSVLLAVLLLVTSVPLTPAFAGGGGAVSPQSESVEGRALKQVNGEYQIYTADDLKEFAVIVNGIADTPADKDANAKLMNDIDLNGSEENPWTPIGTSSSRYTGTFDGNGKTISGLYIDSSSDNYQGLFGYVGTGGTVKDLSVSGTVSGGMFVGGVVGYNNGGTVTGCTFSGSGSVSGNSYVGGVVGVVGDSSGSVKNCYNIGDVSGNYVGGVVGYNDGGRVENCYNIGKVTGSADSSNVGGVVGYNGSSSTVENCYNTGNISGNGYVGGVVGNNYSGSVTDCYFLQQGELPGIGDGSGTAGATGLTADQFKDQNSFPDWDFGTADTNTWTIHPVLGRPVLQENEEGGDGLPDSPYEISTADELENFRNLVNNGIEKSAHAKLMNDIDLSSVCSAEKDSWTPIGNSEENAYTGTFDGNGHKIENLYINTTYSGADNQGLFGFVGTGGTVQNLTVSGNVSGDLHVGGVVGYNNGGTVTGCIFSGSGSVSVTGSDYVGGVVGENNGSVINCYNTSSVTGVTGVTGSSDYVGGVVGDNRGIVENCYNTGAVNSIGNYVGGVVGDNGGPVKNCYNTGTVTGSYYVGGVVGDNRGTVKNCYYQIDKGATVGSDGTTADDTTTVAKTAAEFQSGEVAWLLQKGQTAGEGGVVPLVWGQSNLTATTSLPTLVALNPDAAQPVYKVTFKYGYEGAPEEKISYSNGSVEFPTFERAGYTFAGWTPTGTTISQDTTFTAQWTANTYTVTLHTNDGTIAEGQNISSYTYGIGATLPTSVTREGYTFAGWYEKEDLTGDPVTEIGKDAIGDKAYWAKWEEVENPEPDPTPTPTPDPEPSGPSTGDSTGWDDIRDELENAEKGEQITIDMGDETKVPAEIFETLAGQDITLEIALEGGVTWSVNGQDIPADANLDDLDLGVNLDTHGIPVNVINTITGEVGTVQITLAHDGDFGFTMTLTAPLGEENAGYWANLYHYDEEAEAMNFETAAEIDADGNAALPLSHASQYAIVIDTHSHATVDVSDLFIDIAPDAWYKDAIQYAYDNGLMTGVSATEFAPEQTTTRAMIVSILARLEGVTTAEAAGFADVDDNDWYATAVNWAANVGVVNGYEDNTFQPNTAITREQLAAILMNYAAYKGEDVSNRADLTSYTDQPSTWAEEAMSWAVAEGLISGVTADTLQPQGAATRAQVAAILQRFLSE